MNVEEFREIELVRKSYEIAKILILGNGGLKSSATYQEDEHLHKCVKTLQKIDIQIKEREKQKVIVITGTELLGELSFTIDDE